MYLLRGLIPTTYYARLWVFVFCNLHILVFACMYLCWCIRVCQHEPARVYACPCLFYMFAHLYLHVYPLVLYMFVRSGEVLIHTLCVYLRMCTTCSPSPRLM